VREIHPSFVFAFYIVVRKCFYRQQSCLYVCKICETGDRNMLKYSVDSLCATLGVDLDDVSEVYPIRVPE